MNNKNKEGKYVKVVGLPTLMMLPMKNYRFMVNNTDYVITIPREGNYHELDPNIFTKEEGDFKVLGSPSDNSAEKILYVASLTKIMLACSKYPTLKDNQAFVPSYFIVREDEVDIVGNIIDMIEGD